MHDEEEGQVIDVDVAKEAPAGEALAGQDQLILMQPSARKQHASMSLLTGGHRVEVAHKHGGEGDLAVLVRSGLGEERLLTTTPEVLGVPALDFTSGKQVRALVLKVLEP